MGSDRFRLTPESLPQMAQILTKGAQQLQESASRVSHIQQRIGGLGLGAGTSMLSDAKQRLSVSGMALRHYQVEVTRRHQVLSESLHGVDAAIIASRKHAPKRKGHGRNYDRKFTKRLISVKVKTGTRTRDAHGKRIDLVKHGRVNIQANNRPRWIQDRQGQWHRAYYVWGQLHPKWRKEYKEWRNKHPHAQKPERFKEERSGYVYEEDLRSTRLRSKDLWRIKLRPRERRLMQRSSVFSVDHIRHISEHNSNGSPRARGPVREYIVAPNYLPKEVHFPGRYRNGRPTARGMSIRPLGRRDDSHIDLTWNTAQQSGGGAVKTIIERGDHFYQVASKHQTISSRFIKDANKDGYIDFDSQAGGNTKVRIRDIKAVRYVSAYGYVEQNGEQLYGWVTKKVEIVRKDAPSISIWQMSKP